MIEFAISTLIQLSQMKTEVQVTLCDSKNSLYKIIENNDWKLKKKNSTYFIDNSKMELYKNGVVIRARAFPEKDDVQVVLKRNYSLANISHPIDSEFDLEEDIFNEENIIGETKQAESCEYDLHGLEKKVACKIEHHISYKKFKEKMEEGNWKALLSEDQKLGLQEIDLNLKLDSELKSRKLVFVGPFYDQNYEQNFNNENVNLGITTFGEGSEFSEISVRSKNSEELKAQKQLQKIINKENMNSCENQTTHLTEQKLKAFFKTKS